MIESWKNQGEELQEQHDHWRRSNGITIFSTVNYRYLYQHELEFSQIHSFTTNYHTINLHCKVSPTKRNHYNHEPVQRHRLPIRQGRSIKRRRQGNDGPSLHDQLQPIWKFDGAYHTRKSSRRMLNVTYCFFFLFTTLFLTVYVVLDHEFTGNCSESQQQ